MLLEDWATRAEATALKLYQALKEIGREDSASELEPLPARSSGVEACKQSPHYCCPL